MTVLANQLPKRKRESLTDATLLMLISIGIFLVMYVVAVLTLGEQGFSKPKMFFDILNENAHLIIIGCSLTIVMIGGGINISVGGVIGLTAMSCALLLNKISGEIDSSFLTIAVTLGLALGIGLAFGLLQGFMVSYLDIQPFIVTLAGMVLARGLTSVQSSRGVSFANQLFKTFKGDTKIEIEFLGTINRNGKLVSPSLELGSMIAIGIVILVFLFLRYVKTGRHIYALGGNQQSAMMLGINVKRTRFWSYVISGLLSGLAGFVYILHNSKADPSSVALRGEMDAIAASIVGGTLLTGGVGNVIGTFFGVMILSSIQKIIGLSGLKDAWWQQMASGAMLGLFIVMQSVILWVRGKRRMKLPQWLSPNITGSEVVPLKDSFDPGTQEDKRAEMTSENVSKAPKPIRLRGIKKPEIQANIAAAEAGEILTVKWKERPGKEGRWLISGRSGLLGALEADACKEGQTVILASVEKNMDGEEPLYKPYVTVK